MKQSTWIQLTAALLCLYLGTLPTAALEPPRLLVDLETTGTPFYEDLADPPQALWGSHPAQLLPDPGAGLVYFVADDRLHGTEVWRTNGTAVGTTQVTDICAGECGSVPFLLGWLGDVLLFWADDGVRDHELWRTDGTPQGTWLVKDIHRDASGYPDSFGNVAWIRPHNPHLAARLDDALYFAANDGETGREMWRTDGTTAGTYRVADINPGPANGLRGGHIRTLERVGDRVLAVAVAPDKGEDVWAFSANGATLLFKGCNHEAQRSFVSRLIPLGGVEGMSVVYSQVCRELGTSNIISAHLMVTDGTRDGTHPLRDFAYIQRGVEINDGTILHTGDELWFTDGTEAGTRLLRDDISAGNGPLLRFGERAALRTYTSPVVVTDGTPAGTDLVDLPGAAWALGTTSDALLLAPREERGMLYRYDDQGLETLGELSVRYRHLEVAEVADHWILPGYLEWEDGIELYSVDAGAGLPPPPCPPEGLDALCLHRGRFDVEIQFRDPRTGNLRAAQPIPSTDAAGHFYFFTPNNVEVTVKVIDGRSFNGHWWLYAGAVTDLAFEVLLTDRVSGTTHTWQRPAGDLCGLADIEAVPDATPAHGQNAEAAAFLPDGLGEATERGGDFCNEFSLCLQDGRFDAQVSWINPATGQEGRGIAVPFAGNESTGAFQFFGPDNLEILVKMLDGRPVNNHWWVYWGGLTDLQIDLRVRDELTGEVWEFSRPAGDLCGAADIMAFPAGAG